MGNMNSASSDTFLFFLKMDVYFFKDDLGTIKFCSMKSNLISLYGPDIVCFLVYFFLRLRRQLWISMEPTRKKADPKSKFSHQIAHIIFSKKQTIRLPAKSS